MVGWLFEDWMYVGSHYCILVQLKTEKYDFKYSNNLKFSMLFTWNKWFIDFFIFDLFSSCLGSFFLRPTEDDRSAGVVQVDFRGNPLNKI